MSEPAPPAPAELTSPGAIVAWHWNAGRLVLPATPDGTPFWPPSLTCPGTADPPQWVLACGRGEVYATTTLHTRDSEPRNIAIIQLDEGPCLMSSVEGVPGDTVAIGLHVVARFSDPAEDGTRVPLFDPAESP